ncbi:MAG TPA: hypothetical protein VHG89_02345 [Verrucomicrobiae bacterium]|nr:hypothetical protein [Verrucomicrobiae bacterium]
MNRYFNKFKNNVWICFVFVAAALFAASCASPNVNPPKARSHTGYVDFFAGDTNLCWQVDRISKGNTNQVYIQFGPLGEHILRLAFAPGHYEFRVTFLNHVITQAGIAEVEVKDGMVTPVLVILDETGKTLVRTRETSVGGTYYGSYGRNTRINTDETAMFQISLEPKDALPYKPKMEMPYAHPDGSQ